uniref:polynucleotide adenylyltransferase n=1 Tax=Globodera rostochiensis TaxID=31243 RepID=A0A914HYF0_GLORO
MLHKLLEESYFDEGNYEIDDKKRTELKRHLEEELFLTDDDDDSAFRILNKIEALNKFDESAAKNAHLNGNIASAEVRAKSTMNRQKMEQINAILTVLWNHAIQLKVIELLLTRKEMFKMHRLDESVMNGRTLSNFRTIHAYVELWAKDKNLFNGQLNSQMIILMLTKVLLLFPGETSVPFLLEKFFLIYSLWDWPKPLQLTEIDYEKKGEFLLWSPAREWFDGQQEKGDRKVWLGMPIISPIFPEQNVSNRIDTFTIKKMQNEFAKAFNQIRTAKDGATFVLAEESKKDDDKSDQKSFL